MRSRPGEDEMAEFPVVWDEYDELIRGLPVVGLLWFRRNPGFNREAQAIIKRKREEMIAEYERKRAEAAAAGASPYGQRRP